MDSGDGVSSVPTGVDEWFGLDFAGVAVFEAVPGIGGLLESPQGRGFGGRMSGPDCRALGPVVAFGTLVSVAIARATDECPRPAGQLRLGGHGHAGAAGGRASGPVASAVLGSYPDTGGPEADGFGPLVTGLGP